MGGKQCLSPVTTGATTHPLAKSTRWTVYFYTSLRKGSNTCTYAPDFCKVRIWCTDSREGFVNSTAARYYIVAPVGQSFHREKNSIRVHITEPQSFRTPISGALLRLAAHLPNGSGKILEAENHRAYDSFPFESLCTDYRIYSDYGCLFHRCVLP
jgi:hypothetical protein